MPRGWQHLQLAQWKETVYLRRFRDAHGVVAVAHDDANGKLETGEVGGGEAASLAQGLHHRGGAAHNRLPAQCCMSLGQNLRELRHFGCYLLRVEVADLT